MKSRVPHIDAVETVLRMRFERQIRAHQVMPAEEATCGPFPDGLDPRLAAVLRERGSSPSGNGPQVASSAGIT